MLIDTHAHVQFSAFKDEYREVLARAREAGVLVVNVGTQLDTSRQALELAEKFQISNDKFQINFKSENSKELNSVYAVVGLHPVHTYSQHVDEEESHFTTREEHFDSSMYRSLAQNPLVVGVGECGLDYYRLPEMNQELGSMSHEEIKRLQKEAFVAQIRLAKELDKALVIHCRPSAGTQDAYEDILAILDQELPIPKSVLSLSKDGKFSAYAKASSDIRQILNTIPSAFAATPPILGGDGPTPLFSKEGSGEFRFEIHSFTGSPDIVQEFLKRGAYVGLNGIITFGDRKSNKNRSTSAEALAKAGDKTGNMEAVLKAVPLDRIVLETDAPYLAPVPYRGKKNEPAYVLYVAQKVAEFKNLSLDEVRNATTANARALFQI